MRSLLAAVLLIPVAALAEGDQVASERPYWSRCGDIYMRRPFVGIRFDAPFIAPGGSYSSSGGGGGGGSSFSPGALSGGGGKGAEALLVLAVVAAALLPFIIYALDSDADALTIDRFHCPEFQFSAMAG